MIGGGIKMQLNEIFKNSNYDNIQFTDTQKKDLEDRVFIKDVGGKAVPYIVCIIRKKDIKLTPEEAVRQLILDKLINEYKYSSDRIKLETPIS